MINKKDDLSERTKKIMPSFGNDEERGFISIRY